MAETLDRHEEEALAKAAEAALDLVVDRLSPGEAVAQVARKQGARRRHPPGELPAAACPAA
jgi:hypothetical protein